MKWLQLGFTPWLIFSSALIIICRPLDSQAVVMYQNSHSLAGLVSLFPHSLPMRKFFWVFSLSITAFESPFKRNGKAIFSTIFTTFTSLLPKKAFYKILLPANYSMILKYFAPFPYLFKIRLLQKTHFTMTVPQNIFVCYRALFSLLTAFLFPKQHSFAQ